MSRLKETTVQHHALRWLTDHYEAHESVVAAVARPEATVRPGSKFGHGRADGVIAAQQRTGSIHVASLEAKSSKTRGSVQETPRDWPWRVHGLLTGAVAFAIALRLGWSTESWIWMGLVPLLVFLVVSSLYLWAAEKLGFYYGIELVEQVQRYPGNEQWVALPLGLWRGLFKGDKEQLRYRCRRGGIGILLVARNGNVAVELSPSPQPTPKALKDFLLCYCAEGELRQRLKEKEEAPALKTSAVASV